MYGLRGPPGFKSLTFRMLIATIFVAIGSCLTGVTGVAIIIGWWQIRKPRTRWKTSTDGRLAQLEAECHDLRTILQLGCGQIAGAGDQVRINRAFVDLRSHKEDWYVDEKVLNEFGIALFHPGS